MKDLVILGLAAFGGYVLYQNYKNKGGVLPSPSDAVAKSVASQPQQLYPLTTVLDPRDDTVNQSWYVGPREVLSTPLTDILNNLGIAGNVSFDEKFQTAPLV